MNTTPEIAAAEAAEDDFLAGLRIDQSYNESAVGVRKVLLTVPVRKPNRDEFFRTHDRDYVDLFMVELKTEREVYFARQEVAQLLAEFVEPVRLRYCVSRQGVAFLWPTKLPREDRRGDTWRSSATEAAGLAERQWIRMAADMPLGAYQTYAAVADLGEPRWPSEPWPAVLKIGLRDRIIDSEAHPIARQLLGLA